MKNKLVALGLITLGAISLTLSNDATFLLVTLILGVPLFFAKENYIN